MCGLLTAARGPHRVLLHKPLIKLALWAYVCAPLHFHCSNVLGFSLNVGDISVFRIRRAAHRAAATMGLPPDRKTHTCTHDLGVLRQSGLYGPTKTPKHDSTKAQRSVRPSGIGALRRLPHSGHDSTIARNAVRPYTFLTWNVEPGTH